MGLTETSRGRALEPMEWPWRHQNPIRLTATPFVVHGMGLLACLGAAKVYARVASGVPIPYLHSQQNRGPFACARQPWLPPLLIQLNRCGWSRFYNSKLGKCEG